MTISKENSVICVTGGTGFIGKALISALLRSGYNVVAPSRRPIELKHHQLLNPLIESLDNFDSVPDWLKACNTVVHTAGKAHIKGEPLDAFRKTNTAGTIALAQAASSLGCKRFIFLSSIGVNGIVNSRPFNVDDKPLPIEDYAVSKLEAEEGLRTIAAASDMDAVIIRPPLVYGISAPGNFGKFCKLAMKNLPLPFGAIHNKRSLVALDNLVDLIMTCIEHPAAANQTFLVSDDSDLSTTELLTLLTKAAGKKPRLLPIPVSWLKTIGRITGKQAVIDRLCGNLQVDITHTKQTLGWTPPLTVEEGIARCFDGSDK